MVGWVVGCLIAGLSLFFDDCGMRCSFVKFAVVGRCLLVGSLFLWLFVLMTCLFCYNLLNDWCFWTVWLLLMLMVIVWAGCWIWFIVVDWGVGLLVVCGDCCLFMIGWQLGLVFWLFSSGVFACLVLDFWETFKLFGWKFWLVLGLLRWLVYLFWFWLVYSVWLCSGFDCLVYHCCLLEFVLLVCWVGDLGC